MRVTAAIKDFEITLVTDRGITRDVCSLLEFVVISDRKAIFNSEALQSRNRSSLLRVMDRVVQVK